MTFIRPGALALAAALSLAAGSVARAQEFEGVFTARARNMPSGGEMKTYLKGVRSRMEISMPQGSMAIIGDPVAGETYMVMAAQSMYMVMKMPEAERMVDSLMRREGHGDFKVTATGKTEQVAGHECEYYHFDDGKNAVDVCLAKGIGTFRGAASLFGGPAMPGRAPASAPAWARELLSQGAFPLKVVDAKGMLWEVTSIERKTLEASLFVPPPGYRRMEMPGFGRPPQG